MIYSDRSLDDPHGCPASCGLDIVKPQKIKQSQLFAPSRLLQDLKNIRRSPDSSLELPFASEIVELWMTYCDPSDKSGRLAQGSGFSTDQLSCILQVASFLKDERSLSEAAESMACLLCQYLVRDGSTDQPCRPDTDNSRSLTAALVALPSEPLHLVLQKLPLPAVLALPAPLLPVAFAARMTHGSLNLASAPLGDPAAVAATSTALTSLTGLLRLDLRASRLGAGSPTAASASTSAFASALASLPSLQALFLSNSALGSAGAAVLAPALSPLTHLQLLDLSDNRIGPNGAAALSHHLTTLSALTCLDLALNGLRDPGMRSLSHLLPHLSSLHTLHLSFNTASSRGLAYLSAAISKGLARPTPSPGRATPSPRPRPDHAVETVPPHADLNTAAADLSPLRYQFPLQRDPAALAPARTPAAKKSRMHGSDLAFNRPRRRSHSSRSAGSPPAIPATIPESEALEGMAQTGTPPLPKQGSFPLAARDRVAGPGSPFRPARSTTFDDNKGSPTARAPSRLRVLTLRGNCFGRGTGELEGEEELGRARSGKAFARLEDLVLSNCSLGDAGAQGLAASLQRCSRLRTLRLSGNGIGDAGGRALANAFVTLRTLQRVDFHNNSLGDAGVTAVAESMRMAEGLVEADLSANAFGEAGCAAIAASLPTRMVSLRLCSNALGNRGAAALGEKLRSCTALEELWLASAELTAGGVCALAAAIAGLPRLVRLRLNYNYVGRGGSAAAADCVAALPALRVLELKGCSLKSGVRVIAQRVARLAAIEAVDLSLNHIQQDDAAAVQARLEAVPTLRVLDLVQSREDREGRQL
eukprot:jgi/Ulvmu1/8357/UM042_0063.1